MQQPPYCDGLNLCSKKSWSSASAISVWLSHWQISAMTGSNPISVSFITELQVSPSTLSIAFIYFTCRIKTDLFNCIYILLTNHLPFSCFYWLVVLSQKMDMVVLVEDKTCSLQREIGTQIKYLFFDKAVLLKSFATVAQKKQFSLYSLS